MKKIGKVWILSLLAAVVTIFAALTMFLSQMNQMTRDTTTNTVHEIATHDLVTIENFLERNWMELQDILDRMVTYNIDSTFEMQERMALEGSTTEFGNLYLVAEDGTVYNDRYNVQERADMDLLTRLEGEQGPVAARYDYKTTSKELKEMLLYAIPADGFEVDGIRFVWFAGLTPINKIQDHMVIDSFFKDGQSRGNTMVVDMAGNYIVNMDRSISVNQKINLFEILETGTLDADWSRESIQQAMQERQTFQVGFTDEDGVRKVLFYIPMDDVPWYLLTSVEQTVFTELSSNFSMISLLMVSLAILLSLALFFLYVRSNTRAIKADAAARARSEFLSNMSHEIRTPLNGITGLLTLMDRHVQEQDDPQLKGWILKANHTATYLLTLVSDILDMSKLQAGKMDLHLEPMNLQELMEDVVNMQKGAVQQKNLSLSLETDLFSPWIVQDSVRLKQVLMNIASNACKFTPDGGSVSLKAWQVPAGDGEAETFISCADTGIGMTRDFQEHIWDSFSQEHNQVSNGTRGTGLGMAISKAVMDRMDGSIAVSSEPGKGSTFTLSFRAACSRDPHPEKADQQDGLTGHLSLLMAEDNELNAEILQEILEEAGHSVVHASNGEEAVRLFAQSEPGFFDAILMDMQMPVMDGCQAARAIRNLDRPDAGSISIFACTANSFEEDRQRVMESGMNAFLTKPIDLKKLFAALDRLNKKQESEQ